MLAGYGCLTPFFSLAADTSEVVVIDASVTDFGIRAAGKKFVEYTIDLKTREGPAIRIRRRFSDLRYVPTALSGL